MSGQNLPQHAVTQFTTNIQLLLQQKMSKLRPYVQVGTHRGKQAAVVDQVGAIEMLEVTTKFDPLGRVDSPLDRRWVSPKPFHLPQLEDSLDKLMLITDPQSSFVLNAHAAANRQIDRLIVKAFFADAKVGEEGAGTKTFGTDLTTAGGQNVGVGVGGAASGLTLEKLREARRKLMKDEVDLDLETPVMALTSEQHDDLLALTQVTSRDYNDGPPVLKDGRVTHFMGFDFVHSERLETGVDDAGGTSRACPVWVRSGMHLGIWADVSVDITQRKDLTSHPWQIYLQMHMNATRIEEKRVIRVWCRE